jgi:hypothetical protein
LPIINFDYYVQLKVKTTNNDQTGGKQIPITRLINIVIHLQPQTTYFHTHIEERQNIYLFVFNFHGIVCYEL